MQTERLKLLATKLLTVPPAKFDLENWRKDPDSTLGYNMGDQYLTDLDCGTSGCAVGWACAMPEFQAQGLIWDGSQPIFQMAGDAGIVIKNWAAVQKFFGLTCDQSDSLFCLESYDEDSPTPQQVSERITEFLEEALL